MTPSNIAPPGPDGDVRDCRRLRPVSPARRRAVSMGGGLCHTGNASSSGWRAGFAISRAAGHRRERPGTARCRLVRAGLAPSTSRRGRSSPQATRVATIPNSRLCPSGQVPSEGANLHRETSPPDAARAEGAPVTCLSHERPAKGTSRRFAPERRRQACGAMPAQHPGRSRPCQRPRRSTHRNLAMQE